jgi:hypothetical protein
MNIQVDHIDSRGNQNNRNFHLTRVGFAKHMAIAGQRYSPHLSKFFRTLGMFFHYSAYIQRNAFNNDRFSEPPIALSDPTEKNQFSNLAGKAIADFLSKRIDNSLYTVNYEAAMRILGHKIIGQRPDLIAFSRQSMFALEAKGRSQGNSGNMANHKAQSGTGPIPVNFSVACVSYDLYNQVKCNYHDPYNDNVPYDNTTLSATSRIYYSGLSEFLNEKFFEINDVEIQGEKFIEINLSYRTMERIFKDEIPPLRPFHYFELFEFYRPSLILPNDIRVFARDGITNEINPFNFEQSQKDNLYVDNDRVGLRIRR